MPSIIRGTERLTPFEIEAHIREARTGEVPQAWAERWLGIWLLLPAPVRRFILRRILANPFRRRRIEGTTMVSNANMWGRGSGWGISPPSYTASLLTGTLCRKPIAVGTEVLVHEMLGLTLCFDHDVVDGAVGVRFSQRLKELIEGRSLLDALEPE